MKPTVAEVSSGLASVTGTPRKHEFTFFSSVIPQAAVRDRGFLSYNSLRSIPVPEKLILDSAICYLTDVLRSRYALREPHAYCVE